MAAATSRAGYLACSVWSWRLGSLPPGTPALADLAGVGRPDLVVVDGSGATIVVHRFPVMSGYQRGSDVVTAIPADAVDEVTFGDTDRDGRDDLFVVAGEGGGIQVSVWSASSGFTEMVAEGRIDGVDLGDASLATADRDVDGRDDLILVERGVAGTTVRVVPGHDPTRVAEVIESPGIAATSTVGMGDYDGDGRPDLQAFAQDGTLSVWAGNTTLVDGSPSSWFVPDGYECTGAFVDDDDSIFEADIDWLAARGITRGCDPPANERFCPDDVVTRGQMAAFLVRALGLEPAPDRFGDVEGSVFAADIGALAGAGITRGCDPPANQRFCPDQPVTRAQMAAFLHRSEAWLPEG